MSSGTLTTLGLSSAVVDTLPTTAYLMLGDHCELSCAFCSQARTSSSPSALLSRVRWPEHAAGAVADAVADAYAAKRIQRACFQVTVHQRHVEKTIEAVTSLAQRTAVPICASVSLKDLDQVSRVLEAGAERVSLALDGATPEVFQAAKGRSWDKAWALLESAAVAYPGHIGTHVMVGLGESERDVIELLQRLYDLGVSVGLFAFTPISGTRMANQPQPPLRAYRRIQAARWIILTGLTPVRSMQFDGNGRLVHLGVDRSTAARALSSGEAFCTAGCTGCNRPYYNERPAGPWYNYPRPLTIDEVKGELAALLDDLDGLGDDASVKARETR